MAMHRRRGPSKVQKGRVVLEARLAALETEGRRIGASLPAWTLWAGLAAAMFFIGGRGVRALAHNFMDLRRIQKEFSEVQKENAELQAGLRLIKSDDAHLERVARKELGLMKKGEVEYRFNP